MHGFDNRLLKLEEMFETLIKRLDGRSTAAPGINVDAEERHGKTGFQQQNSPPTSAFSGAPEIDHEASQADQDGLEPHPTPLKKRKRRSSNGSLVKERRLADAYGELGPDDRGKLR
jgi:hypothetical protein